MRRFFPLFVAFAGAIIATGYAQNFATKPVGFVTTAVGTNSIKALALPLDNIAAFTGVVTAVNTGAFTIQTANAGWTNNQFGSGTFNGTNATPHIVRMLSGAAQGRQFRISGNTTDTLTIASSPSTGFSSVANGNQYEIHKVETLASFFGANGTINGQSLTTSGDPNTADNILVRGASSWTTCYNDGAQWLRGAGTLSNNIALLPEQGFLLVKRAGTYNVTDVGAVPISNLVTDLAPNATISLGNRFPVATTLVALGLDAQGGWFKNADPNLADNVLIRGTSSWATFYYDPAQGGPTNGNPGSWVRGTSINQNPPIPVGSSIVLVRHGQGSNIVFNQALPYTP